MKTKKLTYSQEYQREYWKKNKERLTLERQTVLREEIAEYQKAYRKRNLGKYKRYQKKYRRQYYLRTGR